MNFLVITPVLLFLATLLTDGTCKSFPTPDIDYQLLGAEELRDVAKMTRVGHKAKNVILFIGDGMGISAITAGRILQGQLNGKSGEENQLFLEKFPHLALSKTYDISDQVGDSASTGTSIMSGEKVNHRTIGVSKKVPYKDCNAASDNSTWLTSIADLAQKNNMGTGIVTTVRVTHATPASVYAHTASRSWEGNLEGNDCPDNIKDIGLQLLEDETAKNFKVIMGGGRSPMGSPKGEETGLEEEIKRTDKRNLVQEWLKDRESRKLKAKYVDNKKDLQSINVKEVDHIMGLFSDSHMSSELSKPEDEPTLSDMVEVAIKLLEKEKNGYFLMVEGGQIDTNLHEGKAQLALHELIAMDNAIAKAANMTKEDETLIIVTADHSHTLTISGYAERGHSILGTAGEDADKVPYSVLSFANGPGYDGKYLAEKKQQETDYTVVRKNIPEKDVEKEDFQYLAAVNLPVETHGGEDVAIFARGPQAHYFHGVHEESYISHVMQYALCIHPVVKCGAIATAHVFKSLITFSVLITLYKYIHSHE